MVDLFREAASLMVGVAAILTFYTALLHLTRRHAGNTYRFRILRDLVIGIQTLQLWIVAKGLYLDRPWLLYPFVTLLFVSGSLNYAKYFMFLNPERKLPLRLKTLVFSVALLLVGETWLHFGNLEANRAGIVHLFAQPTSHPLTPLLLLGLLVALFQYLKLLRLELGFFKDAATREPVLFSSILTISYMVATIAIAIGFVTVATAIMDSGILLLGLTGIVYLLFENRYPFFFQLVVREERQKKYRKSLIQGLSEEKIMARLGELMVNEKMYRNDELKLDEVAALLMITPHQLSEFLNERMGMNFAGYLNRYRVEEAKELLSSRPDWNTLAVGFEAGFGSKPSFNAIFKQQTGMTPSEYRKKSPK